MTPPMTEQPSAVRTPEPIRAAVERLEGAEGLDALVRVLEPVATRAGFGPFGHVLRGDWLGHALHPLLTDFPLGCWLSAAVLDLIGGRRSRAAATRLVGVGLLAVPPTVASGSAELATIEQPRSRRVAAVHAIGNTAVAGMYLLSWRARRGGRHFRGVTWGLAGGGLALVTGYLGGHLSFAREVGSGERGLALSSTEPVSDGPSSDGHAIAPRTGDLVTESEAADLAGVPIAQFRALTEQGVVTAVVAEGGALLFDRAEVLAVRMMGG